MCRLLGARKPKYTSQRRVCKAHGMAGRIGCEHTVPHTPTCRDRSPFASQRDMAFDICGCKSRWAVRMVLCMSHERHRPYRCHHHCVCRSRSSQDIDGRMRGEHCKARCNGFSQERFACYREHACCEHSLASQLRPELCSQVFRDLEWHSMGAAP